MNGDDPKPRQWTWEEIPMMTVGADGGLAVGGTLRTRRHHCAYGDYPWDHWFTRAKAAGVSEDLAQLGRAVMREADQHSWPEHLQAECGWDDDGAAMLELAVRDPDATRARWDLLMQTDGERWWEDVEPAEDEPGV